MLANNIEKWRIRKALFVRADELRRIYSGQDCRLAGRALRAARDSQRRVRWYHDAVMQNELCRSRACPCPNAGSHEGWPYKFILENC